METNYFLLNEIRLSILVLNVGISGDINEVRIEARGQRHPGGAKPAFSVADGKGEGYGTGVEGMEEGMEGRAIAFTTRPQYQTIYPAIKIVSERFGNLWVRGKRYAIDFVAWPRHFVNGQGRRPFVPCCSSFHPSSFHLYSWMKVPIGLTAVTFRRKMSYLTSLFDHITFSNLI